MASYRKLIVWQKSMDLVEMIYTLVNYLPKEEIYGLSSQMRRAAVSIPSNIAEGHGRQTEKEFYRFLCISQGSKAELETQLEVCLRLNYLKQDQVQTALALCDEVGKMIYSLMNKFVE